jgi:tetratricopeptide (TPR) repeat protein
MGMTASMKKSSFAVCFLGLILCGCAGPKHTRVKATSAAELSQYIRAVLKISQENTAGAEEALKKLNERRPDLEELSSRAASQPGDLETQKTLARSYLQEKMYLNAFQLYQKLHDKIPDDAEIEIALARIWDSWADYSMALQCAQRARRVSPQSAEALELLGRIFLHRKEVDKAIESFLEADKIASDDPVLHANIGYCYLLRRDWEKSRYYLERAAVLDPSIPEVHNHLGIALAYLGDHEHALQEFQTVNNAAAALNNLGSVFLARGQWEHARGAFLRALILRPDYGIAVSNLAASAVHIPLMPAQNPRVLALPVPTVPQAASTINHGLFRVQVYSAKTRKKVNEFVDTLAAKGYKTKIVYSNLKARGIWYGVQVEGFESRLAALNAAQTLLRKKIISEFHILA